MAGQRKVLATQELLVAPHALRVNAVLTSDRAIGQMASFHVKDWTD